jgi:hypothetical protein
METEIIDGIKRIWIYKPKDDEDMKGKFIEIENESISLYNWNWVKMNYEMVPFSNKEFEEVITAFRENLK